MLNLVSKLSLVSKKKETNLSLRIEQDGQDIDHNLKELFNCNF